jgi:hypothetical protein
MSMTSRETETPPAGDAQAPQKRKYVPPKLEKLGTIRDLTRGLGNNNQFDGGHPPGQNKSIL